MDKTGHAAGSCKLLYFFPSTIIKCSSSLSAHIALCPGSLGKMSSSKAVCQVCQTCFRWIISDCLTFILCGTLSLSWNSSHQVASSSRKDLFFARAAWKVFHCGLSALGSAFQYSLPQWTPAGLCLGSIQTGHTWSPPVFLQGQWVMLTALSPSLVVLMSVQSGSHYLHLSLFSPLFFHWKIKKALLWSQRPCMISTRE